MPDSILQSPVEPPQPPPTGIKAFIRHIVNWSEGYVWIPIAILGLVLLWKFSHWFLQRKPLDEGYDFIGLGYRALVCVVLVVLLSLTRQATGVWLTKEEQKLHLGLAFLQRLKTIAMAIIFAYILLH